MILSMSHPKLARAAVAAAVAAGGLLLMNHLAPLQWPSTLVYSGLVLVVSGLLSVCVPPRWLGFTRRTHGLMVGVAAGATCLAAGWMWPVGAYTTPVVESRLDAVMPEYNFSERHKVTIEAPPERVRAALDQLSFADIPVLATLGKIRGAAMGHSTPRSGKQAAVPATPIVEIVKNPRAGFFPLDDSPREFVFGLAGQPWNNVSVRLRPEEFRTWAAEGNVKVAANFRIEDAGPGRSRVITETRIAAAGGAARRKMARYWAFIYPGSGWTRLGMLEALRQRAERR